MNMSPLTSRSIPGHAANQKFLVKPIPVQRISFTIFCFLFFQVFDVFFFSFVFLKCILLKQMNIKDVCFVFSRSIQKTIYNIYIYI